jgi:hypothetical protein
MFYIFRILVYYVEPHLRMVSHMNAEEGNEKVKNSDNDSVNRKEVSDMVKIARNLINKHKKLLEKLAK